MGYFGSEGIYDSNLSFWGKKFKKNFWTQRNFWRMHQLLSSILWTPHSSDLQINTTDYNFYWYLCSAPCKLSINFKIKRHKSILNVSWSWWMVTQMSGLVIVASVNLVTRTRPTMSPTHLLMSVPVSSVLYVASSCPISMKNTKTCQNWVHT